MIRRAFFTFNFVCAGALAAMLALKAGPAIEARLAPVRTDQAIEHIERALDRICWDWVSVKLRPLAAVDLDAVLETKTDRFIVAIYNRDTGMPWARSGMVGLGPHRQSFCVGMPPSVRPWNTVRLSQTAVYPGWLGLWHVPLKLPDVVDPPGAALP